MRRMRVASAAPGKISPALPDLVSLRRGGVAAARSIWDVRQTDVVATGDGVGAQKGFLGADIIGLGALIS